MNKEKKIKEYECEFCGFIPTKSQVRIERKISKDISMKKTKVSSKSSLIFMLANDKEKF